MMGKLTILGIGPGDAKYLTQQAKDALQEADLLCGYTLYVDLIRPSYPDKPVFSTGMTGEMERCRYCLQQAAAGKKVVLLCSGDAGVYGMKRLRKRRSSSSRGLQRLSPAGLCWGHRWGMIFVLSPFPIG